MKCEMLPENGNFKNRNLTESYHYKRNRNKKRIIKLHFLSVFKMFATSHRLSAQGRLWQRKNQLITRLLFLSLDKRKGKRIRKKDAGPKDYMRIFAQSNKKNTGFGPDFLCHSGGYFSLLFKLKT